MEHLHVVAQVREQESQDLVAPVVEDAAACQRGERLGDVRVPQLVLSPGSRVEVLVVRPVKVVEPVERVDRCVRVHDVEQNGQSEPVCRVDELHEVLRRPCARQLGPGPTGRTVATRRREETRNLVAKARIVGVLHDGPATRSVCTIRIKVASAHELDRVVAELLDSREKIARELLVRPDALLRRRDSD